jgi:hypothetical protein
MHATPGPVRLRHRRKPAELGLQLASQRDKAAIPQGYKPPLGTVETIKQEAHLQHLLLVERDGAVHAEPVAILSHPQPQLVRRNRVDPKRLAFRPLDRGRAGIGLQLEQQLQTALQLVNNRLVRLQAKAVAQRWAGLDQAVPCGQLARQVAVGPLLPPADARQHRPPAQPRDIGRPLGAERAYHQAQLESFPLRHQLDDRCGSTFQNLLHNRVDLGPDR